MSTKLAIGDRVRMNGLVVLRKIYSRPMLKHTYNVVGFGKGPNTKDCARIERWSGRDDFLHEIFLDRVYE